MMEREDKNLEFRSLEALNLICSEISEMMGCDPLETPKVVCPCGVLHHNQDAPIHHIIVILLGWRLVRSYLVKLKRFIFFPQLNRLQERGEYFITKRVGHLCV
jgi:hypothetical protein